MHKNREYPKLYHSLEEWAVWQWHIQYCCRTIVVCSVENCGFWWCFIQRSISCNMDSLHATNSCRFMLLALKHSWNWSSNILLYFLVIIFWCETFIEKLFSLLINLSILRFAFKQKLYAPIRVCYHIEDVSPSFYSFDPFAWAFIFFLYKYSHLLTLKY